MIIIMHILFKNVMIATFVAVLLGENELDGNYLTKIQVN
jgi:hypothetical protein